jgi:hypothetical protein
VKHGANTLSNWTLLLGMQRHAKVLEGRRHRLTPLRGARDEPSLQQIRLVDVLEG